MDTNKFNYLVINKNRGWRGLAEVEIRTEALVGPQLTMTFSFSPNMWVDLIVHHKIVVQDIDNYYIITFEDTRDNLPKPTQQRSVLIKNAILKINNVNTYSKDAWTSAEFGDWKPILHFVKNKNNHTTSSWNCIRNSSNT